MVLADANVDHADENADVDDGNADHGGGNADHGLWDLGLVDRRRGDHVLGVQRGADHKRVELRTHSRWDHLAYWNKSMNHCYFTILNFHTMAFVVQHRAILNHSNDT